MNKKQLKAIIEAALFVHGDDGIDLMDLMTILPDAKPNDIKKVIEEMNESYAKDESSAFSIQKFGEHKYRLQTKPELFDQLAKLADVETKKELSRSALEVLSIVAYQGPIKKSKIDAIRTSDSSYQIQKLRDLDLIEVLGKDEENPNANLYGITDNFYKMFNLKGKEDLPEINFDEIPSAEELEQKKEQADKNPNKGIFDVVGNDEDE